LARAALLLGGALGVALGIAQPALALPQVVLVQNSGWMEPFYSDPKSQFKPLVAALAGSVAQPGDALPAAVAARAAVRNGRCQDRAGARGGGAGRPGPGAQARWRCLGRH
jgi:hypothetical protein